VFKGNGWIEPTAEPDDILQLDKLDCYGRLFKPSDAD